MWEMKQMNEIQSNQLVKLWNGSESMSWNETIHEPIEFMDEVEP